MPVSSGVAPEENGIVVLKGYLVWENDKNIIEVSC